MIYAVISDIHANLEAFTRTIEKLDELKPDVVVCLGDIVGYGASPNECVDIVRERSFVSLRGNHDNAAAGLSEPGNFNPAARRAALWTRHNLTEENMRYLAGLPEAGDFGDFAAVHGAPSDPDKYILSERDAEEEFYFMRERSICFFGHTHRGAAYREQDGRIDTVPGENIRIESGCRYLINPGSVGQPRDGDPRASFITYDRSGHVRRYRVEYDVEQAQQRILAEGLDGFLAARLKSGM